MDRSGQARLAWIGSDWTTWTGLKWPGGTCTDFVDSIDLDWTGLAQFGLAGLDVTGHLIGLDWHGQLGLLELAWISVDWIG